LSVSDKIIDSGRLLIYPAGIFKRFGEIRLILLLEKIFLMKLEDLILVIGLERIQNYV